jgi:putative restriction endonuclease
MAALRDSTGNLPKDVADTLLADPLLVDQVVGILLEEHFPESLHEDIVQAVGLTLPGRAVVNQYDPRAPIVRRRDPRFRANVLRAYEHRCAVTGFQAALSGSYFGCEAAHVQWHAYDGPDSVDNGLALEPTLHKLFDAGAWSLTDDRRVLVSAEFTGSDSAVDRIRSRHGERLREPLRGELPLAVDYIRWHREAEFGGVFRGPGLGL